MMQIKEHKILSVELVNTSKLEIETLSRLYLILLWEIVPGGELRDKFDWEIKHKVQYGTRYNAVIQATVPTQSEHIKGEWYTPEKFEAVIRDSFGTLQTRIDEYNKFLDFKTISEDSKN